MVCVACILATGCGEGDGDGNGGGNGDGGGGAEPDSARCDTVATDGLCQEYDLSGSSVTIADVENQCTSVNQGDFTAGASCSTANIVGACVTDQGSDVVLTYYYDSGTFDAMSAEVHCTSLPSCSLSCEFQVQ